MAIKLNTEHLTITGFASDKKGAPITKTGRAKLKDPKVRTTVVKEDFADILEIAFEIFKKKSVKSISETEKMIASFKAKIESANHEFGAIYQNQLDELEHAKEGLISKLEEYKGEGEANWKLFKTGFNQHIKVYEKEVEDFLNNFRNK